MKIYSWNVNGFRAVVQKGFRDWLSSCGADVVCLQETKVHPDQLGGEDKLEGYEAVWNPCKVKKGYSGVAAFYRVPPQSFSFGLPDEEYQGEGRLILMDYGTFYLLNVYFPNGQMSEERLKFKMGYYDAFLAYAEDLRKTKPLVVCGDFNTAHKEIDLKNPKANENTSGFLPVERAWLDKFVAHGYVDTFRMFEKQGGNYSWWSYRFGARLRNAGWRIDYFFVSEELAGTVSRAWLETGVTGSDHCPVGLELSVRPR